MSTIPLPKNVSFEHQGDSSARLTIEPLYPGYGTTLGNVLRRVLLSSLSGAAVGMIKINGIDHEFSHIEHVKEDMVELMLNVKKIRIKVLTSLTDPITLHLHASGEKEVTAGDIEVPSDVEIVNPDLKIATLTDPAAELSIDFTISEGRGYVPVEQRERMDGDVGVIAVDSLYSSVVNVGMEIKNVRVDKMTNYDSLMLDIETDGTRTPEEAAHQALDIILEHLNFIKSSIVGENSSVEEEQFDAEDSAPGAPESADTPESGEGLSSSEEEVQ